MGSASANACKSADKCFGGDASSFLASFTITGGAGGLSTRTLFLKLLFSLVSIPISSNIFSYSFNNTSILITRDTGLKLYILWKNVDNLVKSSNDKAFKRLKQLAINCNVKPRLKTSIESAI